MKWIFNRRALVQYFALLLGTLIFSITAKIAAKENYGLAVGSFILAFLFAWVAVVRELNSLSIYMPHSLRKIVQWAHAMTIEFFAVVGLGISGVIGFFRKSRSVPSNQKTCPILLVHGYLNGKFVWTFHKKFLSKSGFGPIYTISLKNPFQSIRTHATTVQNKAKQIAQETGNPQLILIGHSMGGVVSYYYASKLAQAYSVPQVITIGSPLQGTRLARFGFGQCANEMKIGSELLKDIHEAVKCCSDVKFYNIGAYTDELVIPHTSAVFTTDPNNQYYLEDIGHATMLSSKRVARQLCDWLMQSK